MKIQAYINSGIIESYALGLSSLEEVAEFESLLAVYPELREALSDFETQLELFAFRNEVPPPPGVGEKIKGRMRELPAVQREYTRNKRDGRNEKDASPYYIPVEHFSNQIRVHKYWRPAFIAVFILSKIFLILFLYYFFQNRYAQKELLQLEEKQLKAEGSTTAPGK